MRHTKSFIYLAIPAILSLCFLFSLFIVYQRGIYKWWVNLSVPEPSIIQVDGSRRVEIQVYPNADGIEWLGTSWTDDGKYVEIYNSREAVYASKLMMIDPKKAVYANTIQTLESGNIFGLVNQLPFTLEYRESLWGVCQSKNLFFTAKYLENNYWETRLWKGSQLIKTFQPVKLQFGVYQDPFGHENDPVGSTAEYSNFSPDCRYFTTNSWNTWILDTVNQSFEPLRISSRQFISDQISSFLDTTCNTCIRPSWSPNSHEFAFNSGIGIERYDILSKKRSWLVTTDLIGGLLEWSKTGRWIFGYTYNDMGVISSTGKQIGILEGCENIEHPTWSPKDIQTYYEYPSWSPTEDKLAFICDQYDQSTCNEGECGKSEEYLIIWDLSNLDSR